MSQILAGEHPTEGKLFAAVDASATYIQPQVTELRFAALLAPFRSAEEAEKALIAAGAELEGERPR